MIDLHTRRLGAATAAGAVLGVASGLAIGWGSEWWLAPPAALGLAIAAAGSTLPRRLGLALPLTVALLAAAATGACAYPAGRLAGALNAAVTAAVLVTVTLAVAGWRAALRLEREWGARGWELARALEREGEANLAAALAAERSQLAGEIHDRIGHRLTHVIVRVGRLSQSISLTPEQERTVHELRTDLAEIIDEVGSTVLLLESDAERDDDPDTVLARASAAGMDVTADLSGLASLTGISRSTAARVLAEALANAARHAPGLPVTVWTRPTDDAVELTVSNPTRPGPASHGTGTGLRRTTDRVERLGGSLAVKAGPIFTVSADIPLAPQLVPEGAR